MNILKKEVQKFTRHAPVEQCFTAPASWYTKKTFHDLDKGAVFDKNWLVITDTIRLKEPGNYITGEFMGKPWIVVKGEDEEIRGFYNVCSHHAMCVASGNGTCKVFKCPYHGWMYDLRGRLIKTVAMKGIKNFKPKANGLKSLEISVQHPFVLANFSESNVIDLPPDLTNLFSLLNSNTLQYVRSKTYDLNCNWKVFIDNYCDGGYHVPFCHKDLNQGIDFKSYVTTLHDKYSIQQVSGNSEDSRLGNKAVYSFLYPNFCINRYGPWLDTNFVLPISHNRCQVQFHWYVEKETLENETQETIDDSIAASDKVQMEDEELCHGVQRGLNSGAYTQGRYVPYYEKPMHHFHSLLFDDYSLHLTNSVNEEND